MTIMQFADRAPNEAAAVEKVRRIVMLRASWETQEKLREWAKMYGFDLAWSYSGWPQSSWDFDFHVTVVASENAVRIPDGIRSIDAVTLEPTGYDVLGVDRKVPVIKLDAGKTLAAIREFFISAYGVKPTFDEFKPHVSLSYKWDGSPPVIDSAPALPGFPLVFDALMIATIDDAPQKTSDAAKTRTTMSTADKAAISGTRRTKDGYLVADVRVAKGGNIQDYYGYEIGHADASRVFKVFRPEAEVFKAETLASFAHRPVTMGHPDEGVTADNWRKTAVGSTGSEVVRDGEFVRVPLSVMDAQAIADVEAGVREFSMGYDCELVMDAGTTPDGRAYDAYQRNHKMNHVAIVEVGRAGPECRFGDSRRTPKQQQKDKTPMKTVTIDGKAFEVTDEAAVAIAKLQADHDKASADLSKASATLGDASKTLDSTAAVIDHLKREAEDAKKAAKDAEAKIPTADAIYAAAVELAGVIDAAKQIAPELDTKGKTLPVIKRDAIIAKLGADAVKDKSDEYVAATFDLLSQRANDADPLADALTGKRVDARDSARVAYEKNLYGNA